MAQEKIKVGQKVWVQTTDSRSRLNEPKEVSVAKIGHKYITLDNGLRFHSDSLLDANEFSRGAYLYLSYQDILDKQEHTALSEAIRKVFGQWGNAPPTLEQLRSINDIINSK